MTKSFVYWVMALAVTLRVLLSGGPVCADESKDAATKETEEVNTGQDKTMPLARFDVRYKYQDLPSGKDQHILTLRADKPFVLNKDWSLGTRIDVPLVYNDVPSRDNPRGAWNFGGGDVLIQTYVTRSLTQRTAFLFGEVLVFPTGSQDQMGTGKFQVAPLVAYRLSLPEISRGSFFLPIARYAMDFAGHQNRKHIRQIQLEPEFNINLPKLWFITFYPTPDIRYNFENHKWSIPFDAMLGKMLTRKIVCSVEVMVPVVKDYHLYDFCSEARIGFFF
jgi:hypothetical protein